MKFLIALSVLVAFGFAKASDFSCKDAQSFIWNLPEADLQKLQIKEERFLDLKLFLESKPSIEQLNISTYSFIFKDSPYEQLWCKLKSQAAIVNELKVSVSAPAKSCADLNRYILSLALNEIISAPEKTPTLSELGIVLLDDKEALGGGQWSSSNVTFDMMSSMIEIEAVRLISPLWLRRVGGMNYCKIISPKGATSLIADRMKLLTDSF
ncbi:MAG: hypothetical protein WCI18_05755 [Pseudomonadota bacterium]